VCDEDLIGLRVYLLDSAHVVVIVTHLAVGVARVSQGYHKRMARVFQRCYERIPRSSFAETGREARGTRGGACACVLGCRSPSPCARRARNSMWCKDEVSGAPLRPSLCCGVTCVALSKSSAHTTYKVCCKRVLQECFKSVQERYKRITSVSQACYKSVTSVLQACAATGSDLEVKSVRS
jgi:hypothetical protein